MKRIIQQLDDEINRWGLTQSDKKAILSRIKGTTDYNDLANCDLILESVNSKKPGSNLEVRKDVFRRIEAVVNPEASIRRIFTSMISEIASVLERPDRAIGLHFMSPATTIKIVEVVKGIETSQKCFETVCKFAKMIDRKVFAINESPGRYISTRLIVTLINESCQLLMEGVASVELIDKALKEGYGMQFGPFELADKIGLDKVVKWMDNLYTEYSNLKN